MRHEFKFPDIGEGLHEAEIVKWFVQPNDVIQADQVIAEVQTDKAIVEIPSPVGGKVISLAGAEGCVVRVGEVLIVVEQPDANEVSKLPQSTPQPEHKNERVTAAPTVRKLARELGVDLAQLTGTGPNGRIVEADVHAYIEGTSESSTQPAFDQPNHTTREQPINEPIDGKSSALEETIPLRGLRKRISEKMVRSVYTAPQATGMDDLDVTQLVQLRDQLLPFAQERGCKLTFLPFIIKAVTKALQAYPHFNSTIDQDKATITLKKYYNIGIATATPEGLLVPVIKNADQKSIIELGIELEQLIERVHQRKIEVSDLQGGTFTISSTGKQRGRFATPIVNYPEVAILGVHAIKRKPIVLDESDEIVIRSLMGTSLTFDHRIIDGYDVGLFMGKVAEILENPHSLVLEAR